VTSPPDAEGMDAEVLNGSARQFEDWPEANLHAALMVRHAKLIYEHYFTGDDRAWATSLGRVTYHAGLKHDLRSITKSITSLLVDIGVDPGSIKDLDEPVFIFLHRIRRSEHTREGAHQCSSPTHNVRRIRLERTAPL
jgi:hypothetical protein